MMERNNNVTMRMKAERVVVSQASIYQYYQFLLHKYWMVFIILALIYSNTALRSEWSFVLPYNVCDFSSVEFQ